MTAPRIDHTRKYANNAVTKIAEAIDHIEDLHAIGWYRHADQRARERVAGGSTDWSLDNHGDPNARAAYEQLANALLDVHKDTTNAIEHALQVFDPGLIRARRDQTADATSAEVIAALGRLEKRKTEGEWVSATRVTQPMPKGARRYLDATALQDELDHLRAAVRKAERPDRARLTPRELTAWNNATGTAKTRRKKPRKRP